MDWALWAVGGILLLVGVASWLDMKARVGRIERKLTEAKEAVEAYIHSK